MKEQMTKLNKEANMLIKEIRGVLDDGEYTLDEITPKCIRIFALRIQRQRLCEMHEQAKSLDNVINSESFSET